MPKITLKWRYNLNKTENEFQRWPRVKVSNLTILIWPKCDQKWPKMTKYDQKGQKKDKSAEILQKSQKLMFKR